MDGKYGGSRQPANLALVRTGPQWSAAIEARRQEQSCHAGRSARDGKQGVSVTPCSGRKEKRATMAHLLEAETMTSILKKGDVQRARVGPRETKDPRSKEYAIQTLYALKRYAESLRCDQELVEKELAEIELYRHWEVLGYASKDELLATELTELGRTNVALVAAARANPLAEHRRPTKEERDDKGNNITFMNRGTGTSYTLRRLARDAPEMLDRIEAGELSVNAAAIQAGIRRKATRLEVLMATWRKATPEDRAAFLRFLETEREAEPQE